MSPLAPQTIILFALQYYTMEFAATAPPFRQTIPIAISPPRFLFLPLQNKLIMDPVSISTPPRREEIAF